MMASELIKKLQEQVAQHGDKNVVLTDGEGHIDDVDDVTPYKGEYMLS